jgi:DNA-binding transcriptional MerR regulator
MLSTTPAYNLKAVLQETGLAADTLRAWERRYGLPTPRRSPGGHRLYSQRDIETIKWLMAHQAEGLSISRAVDLWKEQTASGADPVAGSHPLALTTTTALNLDAVRRAWITACLSFNETQADQILNQAFALYPLEAVCAGIIQRGLSEIGERWYNNEATVQQEHFASALAQRRLDTLIAATPAPTRPQTVLIGCTPGESHVFPALLLTLLLRRRGLPVIYLGANVPLMQFDETVDQVKPALVILTTQQLHTADLLRDIAQHLNQFKAQISFGGRIFNLLPELRELIPAHFLGETIEEAVQNVEILISGRVNLPQVASTLDQHRELAEQFRRKRAMIDMNTLMEAGKLGLPSEFMNTAVQNLGDNLHSAVSLGHLQALKIEFDWIRGLMQQHNVDPTTFKPFVQAYAHSMETAMGQAGREIARWLVKQANE